MMPNFLLVSCKKDSSVTDKESYRDQLLFYGIWLIHRWYYSAIQHIMFMNTRQMHFQGRGNWTVVFFAVIS